MITLTRYKLICSRCGKIQDNLFLNRCKNCGGAIRIEYNYDTIKLNRVSGKGILRYKELLPIEMVSNNLSMGEGETPLIRSLRLSKELGVNNLFLKNETVNPTGSFVDRGVFIAVSKILEKKFKKIITGPSPNLAISLAAYVTRFGIELISYVPKNLSIGKLYQLVAYGAKIRFGEISFEGLRENSYYYVDQSNPYYLEGLKTIIFEIFEQLNNRLPDFLFIPMGTGGNLSMIWKGIEEIKKIGLVDEISTKLVGVQSEDCSHIVDKFFEMKTRVKRKTKPLLDDLCLEDEDLAEWAINAIRSSKGYALKVGVKKILEATLELSRKEGIFPEPSAAAAMAGVEIAREMGIIDKDDLIVTIITGSGLKDPTYIRDVIERSKGLRKLIEHSTRVKKSSLGKTKQLILELLSMSEKNIYEIWKSLGKDFGLYMSYTSVFQHVKELEKMGLISKTYYIEGRKKAVYFLTKKGENMLKILKV